MIKKMMVYVLIIIVFNHIGCTSNSNENNTENESTVISIVTTEIELITLTLDELAAYDGRDGKPAYIAIDDDIYDVSEAK